MNKWILTILHKAMAMATPAILEGFRTSVQEMVDHAKTTVNPWDDILAWLFQLIVGKPGASTQDVDEDPTTKITG